MMKMLKIAVLMLFMGVVTTNYCMNGNGNKGVRDNNFDTLQMLIALSRNNTPKVLEILNINQLVLNPSDTARVKEFLDAKIDEVLQNNNFDEVKKFITVPRHYISDSSWAKLKKYSLDTLLAAIDANNLDALTTTLTLPTTDITMDEIFGTGVYVPGPLIFYPLNFKAFYPKKQILTPEKRRVVDFLIKHGAGVDGTDFLENTPIIAAVLAEDKELALLLLRAGADPTKKNSNNKNALTIAQEKEFPLQELIEQVAKEKKEAATSPRKVALKNAIDTGTFDQNFSNDIKDIRMGFNNEDTPVMYAIDRGQPFKERKVTDKDRIIIVYLLAQGVEVNAQGALGDTAVHRAIRMKDIETIKTLLRNGARVDIPNISGNTPITLAIKLDIPLQDIIKTVTVIKKPVLTEPLAAPLSGKSKREAIVVPKGSNFQTQMSNVDNENDETNHFF